MAMAKEIRMHTLLAKNSQRIVSASASAYLALICVAPVAFAETLNKIETNDVQAAKNSNVQEAERLNGTQTSTQTSKKAAQVAKEQAKDPSNAPKGNVPLPTDSQRQKATRDTANAVNQVPGVKVSQKDLEPPAQPPIKGFHPIKRLLQPVENLEGMSIKLEQQIMKLEGPIAGLQPPMLNLQKKMTGVDEQIGTMQGRLNGMQTEVVGVRSDIAGMRKDIEALREPIVALRGPIGNVAKPLEAVQQQLNMVLFAILIATIAIAIGTPIAAIMVYRHRHKLFPELKQEEEAKSPAAARPLPR